MKVVPQQRGIENNARPELQPQKYVAPTPVCSLPANIMGYFETSSSGRRPSAQADDAHLQGPHSADPDFELAFHAVDVFELNAFPPTPACRFAPEE